MVTTPGGGDPPAAYPILEFDPAREAFIEPARLVKPIDAPEHCVFCFFHDVIAGLGAEHQARRIATQRSEMGEHPVYEITLAGRRLAVFHPGVGAPLAAGFLEEAIALGCRKFVVCGGAGVLGKTWTTDAPYRETPACIARRRAEGCLVVEMEAAALFAVAQFRGVVLGQLPYGGDDLSGAEWDSRAWTRHSARETLFWLAAEACLAL